MLTDITDDLRELANRIIDGDPLDTLAAAACILRAIDKIKELQTELTRI